MEGKSTIAQVQVPLLGSGSAGLGVNLARRQDGKGVLVNWDTCNLKEERFKLAHSFKAVKVSMVSWVQDRMWGSKAA